MLSDITNNLELILNSLNNYFPFTSGVIIFLIIVHLINNVLGGCLNYFGIIPRHILGLPGIIFAPFLHGSVNHLFFNAIPLFVLINMILLYGYKVFTIVTLFAILLSGTLVWLFGRKSIHLGSSSVLMGYFGFLSINAYLLPNFLSIVLILFLLYYFGGLVAALVPTNSKGISVEGHIFGFLSGVIAFLMLPYTINLL